MTREGAVTAFVAAFFYVRPAGRTHLVASELLAGAVSTLLGERTRRVTVEDHGIGFEQQSSDRILSPFQRLHTSYEGTGMGLAICWRIVERHHGTITASSKPDEGTVYTIELPTDQPNSTADDEAAQTAAQNCNAAITLMKLRRALEGLR